MPLHINRNLKHNMNLRIKKALTGRAVIRTNPIVDIDVRNVTGDFPADTDVSVEQPDELSVQAQFVSDDRPFMENVDPWKNPAPQVGYKKWQRLLRRINAKMVLVQKALDD